MIRHTLDKGPVKLIRPVKIGHSFSCDVSRLTLIILSLPAVASYLTRVKHEGTSFKIKITMQYLESVVQIMQILGADGLN